MRLITLPTVRTKHCEAIVHSAAAAAFTVGRVPFDVVHYHALGPGLVSPITRWGSSARVVQTVHGLDNHRAKWGGAAQKLLTLGEHASARVPDRTLVVSESLRKHYAVEHGRDVEHIPNGVVAPTPSDTDGVRRELGLDSRPYVLFVGRLVPEKAPDVLLEAFRRIRNRDVQLVLAGGSSFTDRFVASLREQASRDSRVTLTGFVYGETLRALYAGARMFVLPSRLEGLPLTLLEAASHGISVIASNIAPHREVVSVSGPGRRLVQTDPSDLAAAIDSELDDPERGRVGAERLRSEVLRRYDWEEVTSRTEQVYRELVADRPRSLAA